MDTTWQLLTRSSEAIMRFERANADSNPAELLEARTALESCYAEVKWLVAARAAMKPERGNGLQLVPRGQSALLLDLSPPRGPR